MTMRSPAVALLALGLSLAPPAAADAPGPDEPGAPGRPFGAAWFGFPVVFYMPETRLGYGATGGVHFPFEPGLATSDVQLIAVATTRRQALLNLNAQLFPAPGLALGGLVKLALYPDEYYGIGNDTAASARETLTSRYVEVQLAPEWFLVPDRLRTGPRVWFRREKSTDLQPGGELAAGRVSGADGYTAAGLGWGLTWDGRDNRFFPRSGSYLEAWYILAPGALGDLPSFGRAAVEARHFLPLGRALVIGLAAHLEAAHGSVPFSLVPRLGGDQNLRGYYFGRWRDRLLYAGQAELRFPLAGRFGAVAFAGLSDVASRPSDFGLRTVRPAAGAGTRFRLTDDGVNVRLDVGLGQEGGNVYFALGEAF